MGRLETAEDDKVSKDCAVKKVKNDGFWKFSVSLCIFVCIVGVMIAIKDGGQDRLAILTEEGQRLVLKYDYDGDHVLNIHEVKDLLEEVLGEDARGDGTIDGPESFESVVRKGGEVLNVTAIFEGVHFDSMSQRQANEGFGTPEFEHKPCFTGLLNWTAPHEQQKEFLAKWFCDFGLPVPSRRLGEVFWILPPPVNKEQLSSLRYEPPTRQGQKEKFLSSLLGMFHANVFPIMRFAPRGTAAVIRGLNQHYVEIYFRIHAEFQLNPSPLPQFWFTPGRFEGHMILSRHSEECHVRDFFLELPTESSLNVDMEWIEDNVSDDVSDNLEVDIGFVSAMSLQSESPSSPIVFQDDDGTVTDRRDLWAKGEDIHFELDQITWENEIEESEARDALERVFYPFTKVKYWGFEDAFTQAELRKRPVHHIVLWGALNDQSC